jgi:1A family penicillin-binding protein
MSLSRISSLLRRPSKMTPQPAPRDRKGRIFRFLKKAALVCVGLGAVGIFCFTIFLAWVSRDLPNPDTLSTREVPQSTKIFDRTGKQLLYELHGDEKRTLAKIEDIPLTMQHATISIEDRSFYKHHGVYWKGLVRALGMSVLTQTRVKGTSTLTQQLVKNAILTNERSLMRKAKEFVLALQIERTFSKDKILQLYLNEIPYGSTIYGIESASQSYFGKTAKDLTLDEAALLAAIPQAPDLYSPYGTGTRGDNRPRLVVRQHYILDVMAEEGYVTKEEADAAKKIPTLDKLKPKTYSAIKAPHFVMDVRSQLVETYGLKRTEEGGLRVITSLDWDKQQVAEQEVIKGVEARGKAYKFTNAALISLDPKTGQVLAMVGSKDFYDDAIDGQVNVTLRPRQPGSSFKPIVYGLAFSRGYLPQTMIWDVDTVFRSDSGNYSPRNYDFKQHGPLTLRSALQNSLNTPAVKTLYLVGLSRTLDFAERLGYTTLRDRSRFGLSLALGGGEIRPIEHASAFAAFGNDGVKMPTTSILRVEDHDGVVLQEWKPSEGERVIDSQAARLLADVMSDNQARAMVFSPAARGFLTLPDRPVAAKTGTTNNFNDAWTVGFTPNLATVVWVGNSDGKEMSRGADGSVIAAPIWGGYMKQVMKTMPIERFKTPEAPATDKPALLGTAFMQKVRVVKASGKLATEQTSPELVEERTYYIPHEILYYIDKEDPLGANPSNPAQDPQFENWEKAVQLWASNASSTQFGPIPTEVDDQHTPEMQPVVTILAPNTEETINTRILPVQVSATTQRIIQMYEVVLNGQTIGTANAASFSVILPQELVAGRHTLTIVAIDDVGNRGEASIAINYLVATPQSLPPPTDTGVTTIDALWNTSGTAPF